MDLSSNDDIEKEVITENKENTNVVKISTIPDGSCFIHAILKCSDQEYGNDNIDSKRRDLAYETRKDLAEFLKEPNPSYPTLQSTVKFVKESFFGKEKLASKEKKGQKFSEFLQQVYSFYYIAYPENLKPYNVNYFDSLQEYYKYICSYHAYLVEFDKFLSMKISSKPSFETITEKKGNRSSIQLVELSPELKKFELDMKKVQENTCKRIDLVYYDLMKKLKKELGLELYNPQNFGCPYVQCFLKKESLPKGLYSELPYNCYFFTAYQGALNRFAYYQSNMIPGLEQLCAMLNNNRVFLGDGDIIPFIPSILCINIIVIDFESNQIISDYCTEGSENNCWIVINNINNTHFESCGYKQNKDICTLFRKESPFIQTILKSKDTKGKINWTIIDELAKKTEYEAMSLIELKIITEKKNLYVKHGIRKNDLIKQLLESK
jgi:hypothetical protein